MQRIGGVHSVLSVGKRAALQDLSQEMINSSKKLL